MLLWGMAVNAYLILCHHYAKETVCCLVHLILKDIPGHLQAKWHIQEPISATTGIKSGQI